MKLIFFHYNQLLLKMTMLLILKYLLKER